MKLNIITNTCSMFELGNVYSNNLKDITLKDFKIFTKKELIKINKYPEKFSIIYNCTNNNYYRILKKLGFKQISRYKGYSSFNDVKVLIWKSEKYTFFERIKIFFKLR